QLVHSPVDCGMPGSTIESRSEISLFRRRTGGKGGQVQQDGAHVLQRGRFGGDVEFWRQRVSQPTAVRVRETDPDKLVFKLYTDEDITAFDQVLSTNAPSTC